MVVENLSKASSDAFQIGEYQAMVMLYRNSDIKGVTRLNKCTGVQNPHHYMHA